MVRYHGPLATWDELAKEAPEVAAVAERRLTATGLAMLGTLRKDGFPRISPVEPLVDGDRLVLHEGRPVLGMMWRSTKALDLQRDPRFALHTATADKNVGDGDAKCWGTATEVTDPDEVEHMADLIERHVGFRFEPGTFHAFLPDLLGASTVRVADDVMFVETWLPGAGVRVVEKRN
jgi:hypothetical protein